VPLLASNTTTVPTASTGAGPSFLVLFLIGIAIMFLGNLIGRFLSTRMDKVISRRLYFFITIPVMVLFFAVVILFGGKMSVAGQYVLFAGVILGFSILGGFVETPPMPTRTGGPSRDETPSEELPHMTTGDDTVEGEGKDVTQDSPVDDKTEH
jgi:hypothetical protein